MSTNYLVSGHGDLSTIFKPLTTYPSLSYDTSYSVAGATGAVDLRYKFRPCTADTDSKILYNTNYSVNGKDLKDIFMDISYNPFEVVAIDGSGTNPIIFNVNGSFTATFDSAIDISYAVVGGGGGGGGSGGGYEFGKNNYAGSGAGGGGGGLSYSQFTPISGHKYIVTVGLVATGGSGAGAGAGPPGDQGHNSSISDVSNAFASGGGGGGGGTEDGEYEQTDVGVGGVGTGSGAFSGGNGGIGSGGGGGGGCASPFTAGRGGKGGDGLVVIISF